MNSGITFTDRAEATEYARNMQYEGFGTKLLKTSSGYKVVITSRPDKPIKFWHGTLIDRAESIERKGLVPSYLPPAGQTWASERKAIYFYMDKETAISQAEEANEYEPNVAVFEIELPPTEEHIEKLELGEEGELIYKGIIDPKYIRRIV